MQVEARITELLPSLVLSKRPIDSAARGIGVALPGVRLTAQVTNVRNATLAIAKTFSGVKAQANFGLVQPAAVRRREMHHKPLPKIRAATMTQVLEKTDFCAMGIEIVLSSLLRSRLRIAVTHALALTNPATKPPVSQAATTPGCPSSTTYVARVETGAPGLDAYRQHPEVGRRRPGLQACARM